MHLSFYFHVQKRKDATKSKYSILVILIVFSDFKRERKTFKWIDLINDTFRVMIFQSVKKSTQSNDSIQMRIEILKKEFVEIVCRDTIGIQYQR